MFIGLSFALFQMLEVIRVKKSTGRLLCGERCPTERCQGMVSIVISFLPQHRHSGGDQPRVAALQGPPRLDHGFQHLPATWLQD